MDEQDSQDAGLKHELITRGVIGCSFEVLNEGFIIVPDGSQGVTTA